MRRTYWILAFVVGAVLAMTALANGRTKTIQDGNDTAGKIDIKSATYSRTKSGKLKFVVRFFDTVPARGDEGNEYLEIWKTKPHVMRDCGGCFKEQPYKMQGPQTGRRPVFKGGEEGQELKTTGHGTIRRKGNKLTFILGRKAIGKPKRKFFWRIETFRYGPQSECPDFQSCVDKAPNGSKVVRQKL